MARIKLVAPARQSDDPDRSPPTNRAERDRSISPARQLTQLPRTPLPNSVSHVCHAPTRTPLGQKQAQVEDWLSSTDPPDAQQINHRPPSQISPPQIQTPRDSPPNSNKYADPEFFQKYSNSTRETYGLFGAREWPVLITMIPDITGKSFLDLGCGSGAVCRWALENGVGMVRGMDSSELLLSKACNFPPDSRLKYVCADLELSLM